MKNKVNDAHDAFVRSLHAGAKKKRRKIVAIIIALVLAVVAFFVAKAMIERKQEVDAAKKSVVQFDINSTFKEAEFPPDGDWDLDGLKNEDEKKRGTNIQNEDTDGDGISDGDEILLGLDPLKADTDGDGILDGYELIAGLNPKRVSTDEKTDDGDRIMDIEKKTGEITLTMHADANSAEVTVEEFGLVGISTNTSVISNGYNIYSDNKFGGGKIKFDLDTVKIERLGLDMSELSIFRFDVDKKKYIKIDSVVDMQNKTISADIKVLGTYVVGVEKTVNEKSTTRVFFLIDNSGSMYPEKMCAGSTENDIDFKRLTFAQSLIGKFEDDYQVGISKFTGTYHKLTGFTTDKKVLGDMLSKIRNDKEVFNGTHSQTALTSCINEFGEDSANVKYSNIIVMLTDGESDEVGGAAVEDIIKMANDKNIVILTIGLGRDVDRVWLEKIASGTQGKYYSASDANALDDVYKSIVTTLNYEIVNYSGKDDVKGYSLYNTGFDPVKNGFAFKNFRTATTSSVDFGMAVMARDWYIGELKTSLGDLETTGDGGQSVFAHGYDLGLTTFGDMYKKNHGLHNVNSDLFSGKFSDSREYLNFSSKGDKLEIKNSIFDEALQKGWRVTNVPIQGSNLKWSSVDFLSLDIAGSYDKIAKGYDKSSAEFARALYRLNALQWDSSKDEYKLTDEDGFDKLKKQLSLGVPVVTTIDGVHAVNAIGLIQDSISHRKYILQVYDNIYPDEKKEIYIEKKMILRLKIVDGKATIEKTDFTYSATYEGKQVGISFSDIKEK